MAVAVAGACAALPLLAGQQAGAQQAARGSSVTAPLALTVTSVSPAYAKQGHRVTISGLVRNVSGSAASGLSVRLLSSTTPLGSRQDLENFAAGTFTPAQFLVSTPKVSRQRLDAGQSWRWTVSLPASSLGVSCFGVYPLTVRISDSALQTAHDAVPLPYWPAAKRSTCPGQARPRPYAISWIWPLIDTPHQGACAGLIGDRLAAAIAAGRDGLPAGHRQPLRRQRRADLGHRPLASRQCARDEAALPGRRVGQVQGRPGAPGQPVRSALAGRPGAGDRGASRVRHAVRRCRCGRADPAGQQR
jgi:hypothetical protein